jgi:hypothetical protein
MDTHQRDAVDRMREALEEIARSRVGLQNVHDDHGHDTNAYNFHAMRYFASVNRELQGIARAALSTLAEGKGNRE